MDMKHLFFYCPLSAYVWANFPSVQGPISNNLEEWRDWIHSSMPAFTTIILNTGGYFLNVLIIIIFWKLWLSRNRIFFDNIEPNSYEICSDSVKFTTEFTNSFAALACVKMKTANLCVGHFQEQES